MMKKNQRKTNPKKIPRTEEDCQRAWQQGADFGVMWAIVTILLIMKDKLGFTNEQILEVKSFFRDKCEGYNEGRFSFADEKRAIWDDYDIDFHLSARRRA